MTVGAGTCARVVLSTPSGEVEATAVYTVSQLNQHTADVLKAINEAGQPAVVTRHGRFVAMLTPLANVDVESQALSAGPLADTLAAQPDDESGLSTDQVRAEVAGWK